MTPQEAKDFMEGVTEAVAAAPPTPKEYNERLTTLAELAELLRAHGPSSPNWLPLLAMSIDKDYVVATLHADRTGDLAKWQRWVEVTGREVRTLGNGSKCIVVLLPSNASVMVLLEGAE